MFENDPSIEIALKTIYERFGPDIIKDPKHLKGVLDDLIFDTASKKILLNVITTCNIDKNVNSENYDFYRIKHMAEDYVGLSSEWSAKVATYIGILIGVDPSTMEENNRSYNNFYSDNIENSSFPDFGATQKKPDPDQFYSTPPHNNNKKTGGVGKIIAIGAAVIVAIAIAGFCTIRYFVNEGPTAPDIITPDTAETFDEYNIPEPDTQAPETITQTQPATVPPTQPTTLPPTQPEYSLSPYIYSAATVNGEELGSSNVDNKRTFKASNAIDRNSETCWCVNTSKTGGVGAAIRFTLAQRAQVNQISILNGNLFQPYENIFRSNGQIERFTLTFSDGTSETFTANFNPGDATYYQSFYLRRPVITDYILLTVDSSYAGTKYTENVALTEFNVY